MSLLLEVSDLSVFYGRALAVKDCSLRVNRGEIVAVVGPNGAGKTSLLNAIVGMVRSEGKVAYDGKDVSGDEVETLSRAGLCLVPETRELFGALSVESNLKLGAYSRSDPTDRINDDLNQVYAQFPRLRERRAQRSESLSGGEQQMLALSRALMSKPRLLLLDEPSTGLAPLIVKEIFQFIANLRDRGNSIVLVEQNATAALALSDYAYVMESGEFVLQGSSSELMRDTRVIDTYLGSL